MPDLMRVTIDRDGCVSCARCWTDCPEFFEENPNDNLSQIVEQYRVEEDSAVGDAPEELHQSVRAAADACPTSVIHV